MSIRSDGKVRIGIIGAGNIAQNAHIPAYLHQPDVELVAVCDIKADRAEEVARRYNIKHVFTDFNEMVKLPELDAVSVCTWNNSHAAATIAALEAGKHVLCEKPMAMNVAEAEAMRDAARRTGNVLQIGFVNRYRTEAQVMKEMAAAGKFGEIYFGKATILRRRGTPLGWFTDPAKSGGGPVIDIGVHIIDLTRYLMGNPEPVRVSAGVFAKLGDYKTKAVSRWKAFDTDNLVFGVEDLAGGVIHFANGASMVFDVSWAANIKEVPLLSQVFGTKAGFNLDPFTIYTEDEGYLVDLTPVVDRGNIWDAQIRHFLTCIKTGQTPLASADDGVAVQKILNGIYDSARLGKEVTL